MACQPVRLCSHIVNNPFLVQRFVRFPDNDLLVVHVLASCNIKYKSSFVDHLLTVQVEMLGPDILTFSEHDSSVLSVVLNINRQGVVLFWLNGFSIKDEDLIVAVVLVTNHNLTTISGQSSSSSHL